MADSFTSNGLTVASNTELVTELEADFKNIYGNDINVGQNSPDGQMINIFAQGGSDTRDLLLQTYNSFDPDNASGRVLDARCAINNVFRRAATFTTVNITIVTDRTVTLEGVDGEYNNPDATGYTNQDNAGNEFVLATTQTFVTGTHTDVLFRAKEIGAVETTANTITTPVTVVLGVVSVNNPSQGTTGTDGETDAQLKLRRRQSLSIGSSGYLNGLESALFQLDGVVDVRIYENNSNTTDANGTPAHCIWCVVQGGSSPDIADTIYRKRSAGCDLRGAISYTIITSSSQSFVARWDVPTISNFYVKFNIQKSIPTATFDLTKIANYVEDKINFRIGDGANTSDITTIAQEAIDANGGNGFAVDVLISTDNSNWVEYITPTVATKLSVVSVTPTVI